MYGIVFVSLNILSSHEKETEIRKGLLLHNLGSNANEILGWRIEIHEAITLKRPGLLCMVTMEQSVGD